MHRVQVSWIDVLSIAETWTTEEEARGLLPLPMTTLGWLLVDSPSHLVVAGTISEDDTHYGDVQAIPRGCVREIRSLEPSQTP